MEGISLRKAAPTRRRFLGHLMTGSAIALAVGRLSFVDILAVDSAFARPLDEVSAAGRVRIAVYRDFPPFSWNENGVMRGIDVDIAHQIAKGLGVELDVMELTADENVDDDLRNAVWKGHYLGGGTADVMMHVPHDRVLGRRNDMVALFGPYQRERYAFVRNPDRIETSVIEDLPDDQPLGVEIDTVPDFHLLSAADGRLRGLVHHYMTPELAMAALVGGEVAGVMAPLSHIDAALSKHPEFKAVVTPAKLPAPMASFWDIGMAVKENSRDLAYAVTDIMTAMAADGRLKAIFAEHGVEWEKIPLED